MYACINPWWQQNTLPETPLLFPLCFLFNRQRYQGSADVPTEVQTSLTNLTATTSMPLLS